MRAMRNGESRMKGDERILGQGDFVETVLKAAQENLDRKSIIRSWDTTLTRWWIECSVYSVLLSTSY